MARLVVKIWLFSHQCVYAYPHGGREPLPFVRGFCAFLSTGEAYLFFLTERSHNGLETHKLITITFW